MSFWASADFRNGTYIIIQPEPGFDISNGLFDFAWEYLFIEGEFICEIEIQLNAAHIISELQFLMFISETRKRGGEIR